MKKILIALAVLIGFSVSVNAQHKALLFTNGLALDTVTNTGTEYASLEVPYCEGLSIVAVVTKISGTVGGTISWQGSNDGTNYVTISTSSPSDASANYSYALATVAPYRYYRVSWTGTGTMSASIAATAYVRRK